MGDSYVVAIKPSARRASGAAGEWVLERGRHRAFDTKALAREWAGSIGPRDRTLWVQDAHPLDDGRADGYLLARPRERGQPDRVGGQSNRVGEQLALGEE
jgi:hypothetical protein